MGTNENENASISGSEKVEAFSRRYEWKAVLKKIAEEAETVISEF